ncbi:hypothetical protein EMIT053CA3_240026 [Pseudomonas donghuensis]
MENNQTYYQQRHFLAPPQERG